MKKALAAGTATIALLFGGAGVAHATEAVAPAQTHTTTVAQSSQQDDDNGDNGLWGLAGLLGLVGLAGLKRRRDTDHVVARQTGTATPPRA